jgi:hypothetical protein
MTVSERLTRAKERLNAYYEAELKVLAGQEYRMGTRTLTRANLAEIRRGIGNLEGLVAELEAQAAGKGRRKVIGIIPRDI